LPSRKAKNKILYYSKKCRPGIKTGAGIFFIVLYQYIGKDMSLLIDNIRKAADKIRKSKFNCAYTGAGISVESGIPPFRGEDGLWEKYDPKFLELDYFRKYPEKCWPLIKEIFYDNFGKAQPNKAHEVLAKMEAQGMLHALITQNIDNLHYRAGSRNIIEFHGNSRKLVSPDYQHIYNVRDIDLTVLPPKSPETGEVLKPDFIFFGEAIPQQAYVDAVKAAGMAQVMLVIGTTGEVMPAAQMPVIAKQYGAFVIEINTETSNYTHNITDLFIQGKASKIMEELAEELYLH
jgi:NAD-dependent deacetylase